MADAACCTVRFWRTTGRVLTRLKRQIKIGTEERGAEFGHEFFHGVGFAAETLGAVVGKFVGVENTGYRVTVAVARTVPLRPSSSVNVTTMETCEASVRLATKGAQ